MSVSIGWRPNDPKKLTYVNGGSSFHQVLERLFGDFPIKIENTVNDLNKLQGVDACGYEGARELINAVYDKDSIIVEAEW